MPLVLVIPIERPVDASQLPAPAPGGDPAHKPAPPAPGTKPAPTPPVSVSPPIFFPGNPEQGLPPVLAFPSHDLPTTPGAHPDQGLPTDPRRPHVGGGPAQQPGRPSTQPLPGGGHVSGQPVPGGGHASQLPAGIRVVGPPIYIEGNPPLIGWELPEHPSNKPAPKPPEEAQPKK